MSLVRGVTSRFTLQCNVTKSLLQTHSATTLRLVKVCVRFGGTTKYYERKCAFGGNERHWDDKTPGNLPSFGFPELPVRGNQRYAIPPPRHGLDVKSFLMWCGPKYEDHAAKIKDWPTLFTMSVKEFEAIGYSSKQAWNIIKTIEEYREGWLPVKPWVLSPKWLRKEKKKEAPVARPISGGGGKAAGKR